MYMPYGQSTLTDASPGSNARPPRARYVELVFYKIAHESLINIEQLRMFPSLRLRRVLGCRVSAIQNVC